MKKQTANQLSGRATGALFFAGFGALWLLLALYVRQQLNPASISVIGFGLAALVAASVVLLRIVRRWPRVPDDPATGRAFARINAVEWIAVAAVAFTLARLHLDAYLMCAITAIVGLHMFPLARLFRYWPHYVAGAVMLAWAAASALMTPVGELQGTSALGTGMILWLSAAVTLALAIPASLQREDAPAR